MTLHMILPVPHVTQGAQPWCWAACSRMVIAYFRALKFTPSLEELVEFGHRLPAGACGGDDISIEASDGNTVVTMRVLIADRTAESAISGRNGSIRSNASDARPNRG